MPKPRRRSVRSLSLSLAILLLAAWPQARQRRLGAPAADSAPPSAPVPISTEAVEKEGIRCRTEMVSMRDGTMLATDIYLPASSGPHPVILQRTPYGHTLGHGC